MSCDTFVALPPATEGCIIFGKNSDRPPTEVQEVIHVPATNHGNGSTVQCTYIEIPQVSHTHAVVLSKPAWMWGAEMGANEHSVCIGNEAVWTKLMSDDDKEEKLLGMDLVRLGLERAATAREAVDVITSLLTTHGQGGPCYDDPSKKDIVYHNSFIIADGEEAWVLETAAKEWVAQKIASGTRNLSNLLTVNEDYDLSSPSLKETAKAKDLWSEGSDMNFAYVFSAAPTIACPGAESPANRYSAGRTLMAKYTDGAFNTMAMMEILRDEKNGICRLGRSGSATMGSQVSVLYPKTSGKLSCHWFTATPNPARSVFKPFIFTADATFSTLTKSPEIPNDPAKTKPRFERPVERAHPLYEAHMQINPLDDNFNDETAVMILRDMEAGCVADINEFMSSFDKSREAELDGLYDDAVESEMKFYPKCVKLN